jgi:hypothetical protein
MKAKLAARAKGLAAGREAGREAGRQMGWAVRSTGVERECFAYRIPIWIERCRARTHLSTQDMHLDRSAPGKSAHEHNQKTICHILICDTQSARSAEMAG